MTRRRLSSVKPDPTIMLARSILTDEEFAVWALKHYGEVGRWKGSAMLDITVSQWRYRIQRANMKMVAATRKEPAA